MDNKSHNDWKYTCETSWRKAKSEISLFIILINIRSVVAKVSQRYEMESLLFKN